MKHKRILIGPWRWAKIIACCMMLSSTATAQTAISPTFFGQNAWYIDVNDPDVSGPNGFSALFDARIADVAASGVRYVRIGGIDPNFFPLYNFNFSTMAITTAPKLVYLIDEIRTAGMEPIIQVGYNPLPNYYDGTTCSDVSALNNLSQTNQATIAANLVDYLNNTYYSSNPIEYWIVANEPDLAKSCSPHGGMDLGLQTSAATIASYIREFATKMKDKDNTIKIIGPELAKYGNDNLTDGGGTYYNPSNKIMDDLINNPANASSITGTITTGNGTGKYYIDYVSFHYYPDPPSRSAVIADPSNTQNGFYGNVRNDGNSGNQWKGLAEMIVNNSTGRALTGSTALGIACTEFNLDNNNISNDESSPTGYANMVKDEDYRSFLGGQWMAEVLGQAMNSGIQFMCPWSVQEGSPGCDGGMGYISACGGSNAKRPTYWHYKMIAENFAGTFLTNLYTSNGANHKAFAYKNTTTSELGVIVINQDIQSPRGTDVSTKSFRINFNNSTPSGSYDMKFYFNGSASAIAEYSCTIKNEATMLLVFDTNTGVLKKRVEYSLQNALRTTDTGTETIITSSTEYNSYNSSDVHSNIVIGTGSSIGATSSETFKATNSIRLNGPYSSGSQTLSLQIDQTCP